MIKISSSRSDREFMDVAFHPRDRHVLAACSITGHVQGYRWGDDGPSAFLETRPHLKSCRALCFEPTDGEYVLTAGRDRQVQRVHLRDGSTTTCQADAHEATIGRLRFLQPHAFASGDEDGVVRIWDTRQAGMVCEFVEHEDFIADLVYVPEKQTLLSAGGDGYLSVLDMRKRKLLARSDNMEEELLSLAVMKGGRKVVCGMQSGTVGMFTWGDFGDICDRFPGHPSSVDSLCKLDEDTLLTGSNDGYIRAVNILPNQFLGVLGDHEEFPVERLSLSKDKQWLASCSHNTTILLWPLVEEEEVAEEVVEEVEKVDNEEEQEKAVETIQEGKNDKHARKTRQKRAPLLGNPDSKNRSKKKPKKNIPIANKRNDFFDGLAESEEDESVGEVEDVEVESEDEQEREVEDQEQQLENKRREKTGSTDDSDFNHSEEASFISTSDGHGEEEDSDEEDLEEDSDSDSE